MSRSKKQQEFQIRLGSPLLALSLPAHHLNVHTSSRNVAPIIFITPYLHPQIVRSIFITKAKQKGNIKKYVFQICCYSKCFPMRHSVQMCGFAKRWPFQIFSSYRFRLDSSSLSIENVMIAMPSNHITGINKIHYV